MALRSEKEWLYLLLLSIWLEQVTIKMFQVRQFKNSYV